MNVLDPWGATPHSLSWSADPAIDALSFSDRGRSQQPSGVALAVDPKSERLSGASCSSNFSPSRSQGSVSQTPEPLLVDQSLPYLDFPHLPHPSEPMVLPEHDRCFPASGAAPLSVPTSLPTRNAAPHATATPLMPTLQEGSRQGAATTSLVRPPSPLEHDMHLIKRPCIRASHSGTHPPAVGRPGTHDAATPPLAPSATAHHRPSTSQPTHPPLPHLSPASPATLAHQCQPPASAGQCEALDPPPPLSHPHIDCDRLASTPDALMLEPFSPWERSPSELDLPSLPSDPLLPWQTDTNPLLAFSPSPQSPEPTSTPPCQPVHTAPSTCWLPTSGAPVPHSAAGRCSAAPDSLVASLSCPVPQPTSTTVPPRHAPSPAPPYVLEPPAHLPPHPGTSTHPRSTTAPSPHPAHLPPSMPTSAPPAPLHHQPCHNMHPASAPMRAFAPGAPAAAVAAQQAPGQHLGGASVEQYHQLLSSFSEAIFNRPSTELPLQLQQRLRNLTTHALQLQCVPPHRQPRSHLSLPSRAGPLLPHPAALQRPPGRPAYPSAHPHHAHAAAHQLPPPPSRPLSLPHTAAFPTSAPYRHRPQHAPQVFAYGDESHLQWPGM